jgi:pyruvate dehydrogenase E1 component beta subunit
MTYREALRQALTEEMERDPGVFILGEEVGRYQGTFRVTEGLLQRFGEMRVVDTPISESGIAGMAIGAAMIGLRPVAEFMTFSFALIAADQLVNHAAKILYMFGGQIAVPVVFRGPAGGGAQLSAQHSHSLESWYAHIPGLKVVTPATPADAKGMLKTAIRDNNPVIFMEHAKLYSTRGEVPENDYTVPFGVAEVKREGSDVTLISYSQPVLLALQAAAKLAETEGIDCEVIDLRSLQPLDMETILRSIRKTHRAVVVHEDHRNVGFGAEVVARVQELAFDELDAPVLRVASADVPIPYARNLERAAFPSEEDIIRAVKRVLA